METRKLQRILFVQRILITFKARRVDRQWIDHIAFWQFPGSGNVSQRLRINLNFARWRGQWICLRIFTESFISNVVPLWVALFKDPLLAELFKRWQFRNRFPRLGIQMPHPLFLCTAFSKLLLNAKTFCQFAGHFIDGLTFKARFNHLIVENHVRHIPAGCIQCKVHLFGSGAVRQQDVSIFRR